MVFEIQDGKIAWAVVSDGRSAKHGGPRLVRDRRIDVPDVHTDGRVSGLCLVTRGQVRYLTPSAGLLMASVRKDVWQEG